VNDDASLGVVKEVLGRFMPQAADQLGSTYAEAQPRIQQWLQIAEPMAKRLREQHGALQSMQTALRTGDSSEWTRAAATVLATARDGGQWQALINQLKQSGAPADVLNQFDTVYSDAAVARAKKRAGHGGQVEDTGDIGVSANVAGGGGEGGGFADMGLLTALR
jgi:hypothetical protein